MCSASVIIACGLEEHQRAMFTSGREVELSSRCSVLGFFMRLDRLPLGVLPGLSTDPLLSSPKGREGVLGTVEGTNRLVYVLRTALSETK